MEFINTTNIIIVPSLYCIGYALKATKEINNNYIPLILMAIGAVLGLFNGIHIDNALQGVICAAVAMGIYDTVRKTGKEATRWTKKK